MNLVERVAIRFFARMQGLSMAEAKKVWKRVDAQDKRFYLEDARFVIGFVKAESRKP